MNRKNHVEKKEEDKTNHNNNIWRERNVKKQWNRLRTHGYYYLKKNTSKSNFLQFVLTKSSTFWLAFFFYFSS